MPRTFTRQFRVRQYECDANGHLSNSSYLRYMQETAFDASSEAGYNLAVYKKLNSLWLIRESEIEYLLPLKYDDRVDVSTWVADFRQVSSRRAYTFINPETKTLVARAHTDWAYINTESKRPAKIPTEMQDAFFPEGLPESFQPRAPFPTPPPPPEEIYRTKIKVNWEDIDVMGHVNNATYLDYMNECTMQLIASHGYSWNRMTTEGIGMYARKVRIIYHQPALLDDVLAINTWAYQMKRATGVRYYEIQRTADENKIAEIVTLAAWVDLETGRPIRIPARLLALFKANIVPGNKVDL